MLFLVVSTFLDHRTQSNTIKEAEVKEQIVIGVLRSMILINENKLQTILRIDEDG